jgi:hypothetical protein
MHWLTKLKRLFHQVEKHIFTLEARLRDARP